MKVRIAACNLDSLVPHERMRARHGLPMKFAEHRFAHCVDETKRVYTKALHHAIAAWNAAVTHHPHQHVRRFGHQ